MQRAHTHLYDTHTQQVVPPCTYMIHHIFIFQNFVKLFCEMPQRICNLSKDLVDEIARKYPDLESLNLSCNEIRVLTKVLNRLGCHLKSLDLSDNEIERVEAGCLEGFSELVELNLSRNRIKLLKQRLPPKLECLDLSENEIGFEFAETLSGNESLRHLRLNGNPIMQEHDDIEVRLCKILPSLKTLNGKRVSDILMSGETKSLRLRDTAIVTKTSSVDLERVERAEAQCKAMAKLLRNQEREISLARSEVEKNEDQDESIDRTEARARAFERLLRGWRKQVFSLMVNRNATQIQSRNEMNEMRRDIRSEVIARERLEGTLRREREMRETGDQEIALLRSALELRDAAISERDRQNHELVRKMMLNFEKVSRRQRRRVEMEVERHIATLEGRVRFAYNRLRLLRSARPMREETREEMSKLRTETERLSKMLKRERLEKIRIKEERESMSRVNAKYASEIEELKSEIVEKEEGFCDFERKLRERNERIDKLKSEIKKVRLERNALLVAMRDVENAQDGRRSKAVVAAVEEEKQKHNVEDVDDEDDETSDDEEEIVVSSKREKKNIVRYIRKRSVNITCTREQKHLGGSFRGSRTSSSTSSKNNPLSEQREQSTPREEEEEEETQESEQIKSSIRALNELEALSVELLSDD